jgi:preprotein translocase subunit YajC
MQVGDKVVTPEGTGFVTKLTQDGVIVDLDGQGERRFSTQDVQVFPEDGSLTV